MNTKKRTGYYVDVRPNSIRIKFYIDGVMHRPTLTLNGKALAPTAGNRAFAETQGQKIANRIELGTFSWAEFFPDSPQAKALAVAAAAPAQTFGKVADAWLKSKAGKAAATKDQYLNAIKMWKRLLGTDTPFERLTYQVLATTIGGHPWASWKSQNNYLIPLRGVFTFHYHGPLATSNPMHGIKNAKRIKKLPDPLSADERDLVLADMAKHYDPRITAYFRFAFYTGMRPEELIALQWGDIDWNRKTARVQRVRTFRGSERDGGKSESAVRDVDLSTPALDALRVMKAYTFVRQEFDAEVFEHPATGRPFHDERAQRETYWQPSLRRCGIRQRRGYITRHTYATVLIMAGVPPAYIAMQLGHRDSKQVHETYTRWIAEAEQGRRTRALMEAAFNPTPAAAPAPVAAPTPPARKRASKPSLKRVA